MLAVYSHAAVATLAEELLDLKSGQELALRGSCHVRARSLAYRSAPAAGDVPASETSVPQSTMGTGERSFGRSRGCVSNTCASISIRRYVTFASRACACAVERRARCSGVVGVRRACGELGSCHGAFPDGIAP